MKPLLFLLISLSLIFCQNVLISESISDRANAADDWGHIVHNLPSKVAFPENDEQVREAILYAKENKLKISIRGTGHCTQGQSQSLKGLVINMSKMNKLRGYTNEWVEIEAGGTQRTILDTLVPLNLTTPVQTDYQGFAIGGYSSTTSGLGPASFKFATVSDNILGLTVVTGEGKILNASLTENTDLFNSVRAGLGLFGVITAVRVKVIPLPGARTRIYTCYQNFAQLEASLSNQKIEESTITLDQWETFPLLNTPGSGFSFDPRYGNYFVPDGSPWVYLQQYGVFYNSNNQPNDTYLSTLFQCVEGTTLYTDLSYLEWIYRLDSAFDYLKVVGAWILPHPWVEFLLDVEAGLEFLNTTLQATTASEAPNFSVQDIILIKKPTQPGTFQLIPETNNTHYLTFGILRQFQLNNSQEIYPEIARLVDLNDHIRKSAYPVGGLPAVSSTLPQSVEEWKYVFGEQRYNLLRQTKKRFDPLDLFVDHGIFDKNDDERSSTTINFILNSQKN